MSKAPEQRPYKKFEMLKAMKETTSVKFEMGKSSKPPVTKKFEMLGNKAARPQTGFLKTMEIKTCH